MLYMVICPGGERVRGDERVVALACCTWSYARGERELGGMRESSGVGVLYMVICPGGE